MPKTYYKKVRTPKPRNPVFSNMVQRKTMSINDKREKVARRRHQHEMFQAKLLRKDLKDEDR
tara:strand:+ start:251 stop:436 length:186 start_codon:yes stop_codon:yes gene_type:complete